MLTVLAKWISNYIYSLLICFVALISAFLSLLYVTAAQSIFLGDAKHFSKLANSNDLRSFTFDFEI